MMISYDAGALVADSIKSFIANQASVHEQLCRVDYVVRLALALSASAALNSPAFAGNLSANPGIGAMRDGLRQVEKNAGDPTLKSLSAIGLAILNTRLPYNEPIMQSVEGLRNHLFHGGALPTEVPPSVVATALSDAVNSAVASFRGVLIDSFIDAAQNSGDPWNARLRTPSANYDLYPMVAISATTHSLLVFSRLTSSAVVLTSARYEPKSVYSRGDAHNRIRRLFKSSQGVDSTASDFVDSAIEDLEGFKEPGTSISHVVEPEGTIMYWVHANGATPTPRADRIRVGPDNTWQWFDGLDWSGYSSFLRELSNWDVLTQRLSHIMDAQKSSAKNNEDTLLPLPEGVVPPFIPPLVRVGPIGAKKTNYTLQELATRLDIEVKANRGTTYLYFVHGEAGVGKTTALIRTAQGRAAQCAAGGGKVLPLFLYISARGNVLENLDQAINATVAETRVVTSDGVKALCRNGLVIPVIDGFDELVGSPTYADALASLRPWLKSLGGRGILIVSARSNYFVSLYEESIRRETNHDINVSHIIVELDKWGNDQRDSYLESSGVPASRLAALPETEREILRLPFFARASIDYLTGDRPLPVGGLVRMLMRGYVDREQEKLKGPTGEVLISADDIDMLFEELAAYMMEYNTRELPLDELSLTAGVAFSKPLSPEIQNRLGALCGLDVREGRERRFRFLHEIILDFFFGRRIGTEIERGRVSELRRILSRCQLTAGSARVASGVCVPSAVLLGDLMAGFSAPSSSDLLGTNAGMLWAELLNSETPLGAITISGVNFPSIRLHNGVTGPVDFADATFASLAIAGSETRTLKFTNCRFQEIRLEGSGRGLIFENCLADAAMRREEYEEDPEGVVRILRDAGAIVVSPENGAANNVSPLARAARLFLEKIDNRATTAIVIGGNRLPPNEDGRFAWIGRNSESWRAFLRALEENGLISLEQMNAGGPTKWRVRWNVIPRDILESDEPKPGVREFWSDLTKS